MKSPYVFKKCEGCGKWLVAYSGNFDENKKGKYGLEDKCKECKVKGEDTRC